MVSCGFTKSMIMNLTKDDRGLPKVSEPEHMNYTEWFPGEFDIAIRDQHFTIALPQGMVPHLWDHEMDSVHADFATVKQRLSKVNNHEIILLTDRSFCLWSSDTKRSLFYNELPQGDDATLKPVDAIEHFVDTNLNLGNMGRILSTILHTKGWRMHDPRYVTKWCQMVKDHVVRDMKQDGVGNQDNNWNHPPCANMKLIMQLSGIHETDGRRENDEFSHDEDWSQTIGYLTTLIAQFNSVVAWVPANHFAMWGRAREDMPQAGPLFRVTEAILALRSQGVVFLPMENIVNQFTSTLGPSHNSPVLLDSNNNLNTMHSIMIGFEAMSMVPMTVAASEWNQRIRNGNSLPFLSTETWQKMFPFGCLQEEGYRTRIAPEHVNADMISLPEYFRCMHTGHDACVPFTNDRVNRERLLVAVNTLNGVVRNRTVVIASPAITPARFEDYWFLESTQLDLLARGPCRFQNSFIVAFYRGIINNLAPTEA